MRRNLILAALGVALSACVSGAELQTAHAVLDTITDVTEPSYRVFKEACSASQWAVTRDSNRTVVQKRALVAKIRSRCHEVYDLFEAVVDKQLEARRLLDSSQDVAGALAAIAELRRMFAEVQKRSSEVSPEKTEGAPYD